MTVLVSAVAFAVLLSVLILIHEWGHFYAARKSGVIVEEFGFGLPPRAATLFKSGGTMFTLNWIPFGGFVRLKGENAFTERQRTAKGSFGAASYGARICILCAGVFMNFLLAVILLTIGFSKGQWIPTYLTLDDMEAAATRGEINMTLGVMVDNVISGGGAAQVGVPAGSFILSVDDQPVKHPEDVATFQEGKWRVKYTVLTPDDEELWYRIVLQDGLAGVVLRPIPRDLSAPDRDVVTAFMLSLRESKVMTQQTVIGIGKLFASLATSGKVPDGITGIVGIAQLTHESVQESFMTYLRLVALLSLSLAVLNILPFPALDGGRLLFVLAEMIARRPLNRQFEMTTNAIGFVVLILLIVLITFHDIVRLF
jgi:regulator of sigma E protease